MCTCVCLREGARSGPYYGNLHKSKFVLKTIESLQYFFNARVCVTKCKLQRLQPLKWFLSQHSFGMVKV